MLPAMGCTSHAMCSLYQPPQPTPSIILQISPTKSSTSSAENEAFLDFNSEFSFFVTRYLSTLHEAVSGCDTSPV